MSGRRLAIATAALVVVGLVLLLGIRWLTSGGAPLPSTAGASGGLPAPTRSTVGLPRPDLTPGAINPAATQDNLDVTVCKSGWASSIRPPSAYTSALKVAQIVEYGYADKDPRHYQEDHLVALEIGGAPRDPRNLWPQPNEVRLPDGTAVGSGAKDGLEDYLHSAVCAGAMPLGDAQRLMAGDWIAAWEAAGRP